MYSARKAPFSIFISIALIFCIASFAGGYLLGVVQDSNVFKDDLQRTIIKSSVNTELSSDIDFDLFWEVWDAVKTKHVDQPVDDKDLFYGAIEGITSAVDDPYTTYFSPELAERFNEDISGKFDGIGAEIGVEDSQLQIIAPLANAPAEEAGLRAGDNVISIDETDTYDMSLDEAVNLIRGERGTTVVLTIFREGDTDVQDIPIVRDTIKIPTVEYTTTSANNKNIAVITLSHFNSGASADFAEIANQVLRDNPDGLIVDLRNNPGGLLEESITISSHFISDGVIVSERFSDGSSRPYYTSNIGSFGDSIPVAVLINRGSASASEIVAGALQDYGKATIIGEQSFGKGSVQDYEVFEDNSSLKVTVAHWFTPNGRNIDEEGIQPDIEVVMTAEDYEADLDPQLDRAVEYLTN